MPSRSLSRALSLALCAFLALPNAALAIDPPSTPQPIHSIGFGAGDTRSLEITTNALSSEPPPRATWGALSAFGRSGASLWAAGTPINYPLTTNVTSFWKGSTATSKYPYFREFVQTTDEPVVIKFSTPGRLEHHNQGNLVSTIKVRKLPGGDLVPGQVLYDDGWGGVYEDYFASVNGQGYTILSRGNGPLPTRLPSTPTTVSVSYKWPTSGTRGYATLDLPELADYYRSWLSFNYIMPSVGASDSFRVRSYADAAPTVIDARSSLPPIGAWTPKQYELSASSIAPLSRRAGAVEFLFWDFNEPSGTKNGFGPAVDDISVTGYKYGPVSAISTAAASGAPVALDDNKGVYGDLATITLKGSDVGQTKLVWNAPPTSLTDATADDRTIGYRVWRKEKVAGASYVELTGERTTARELPDAPAPNKTYTYAVQAWDPGTGTGYGQAVTKDVAFGPAPTPDPNEIEGGQYQLDDRTVTDWTGPSTVVTAGPDPTPNHTLKYRVRDNEGEWSEWKTITFDVKSSTSLAFSAPSTSSYGSAKVTGKLTDKATAKGIGGKPVKIEYSYDNFKTVASSRTVNTLADGSFSYSFAPTKRTYYRAQFAVADDPVYAPSSAVSRTVTPKAYLTINAPSTMYYNRAATVSGFLKPRHTAGTYPVRIYKYRYVSGKWRSYGYVKAKASNYSSYTKYSASVKLPYKGKWRLRTYHPADSLNAATYTGYDYVTVR